MQMDPVSEKRDNNSDHSVREGDEDHERKKSELERQIRELKSIILEMESSLNLSKFGNTKSNFHLDTIVSQKGGEITNVNIQLQNHLYRYSGFHCVAFRKNEYIFNFLPASKYNKKQLFSVQILNEQSSGVLGKWVMPPGVNLNRLQSQIPVNNLKSVPRFLRTCKHYVDCYCIRDEQYTLMMDITSNIKNCSIQTNEDHTNIVLDLFGVYDEEHDAYIDLMVYLFYHINETRPYKTVVDSMTETTLDQHVKKSIEKSLKCFKKLDLHIAFGNMLNEKPFIWTREDNEDSPLAIDTDSTPDEGYLDHFSWETEKTLNVTRQRKRRKKYAHASAFSEYIEKSKDVESTEQTDNSFSEQSTVVIKSLSRKQRKKYVHIPAVSAHVKKSAHVQSTKGTLQNFNEQSYLSATKRRKLRQRKLNFSQTSFNQQNNTNLSRLQSSVSGNKVDRKRKPNKPFTSTPNPNDKRGANNASTNIDISDIPSVSNNLNDIMKKPRLKKKGKSQNNTPGRVLQSKMKKNMKQNQLV